ncbi:ROK family protein [Kocuria sp. M1R5S2]|uniref:ROK family transcriptional regulator n=1 Tax=Kocuria rhizosphaerae TaxID=3376285 RepID=UPI00378E090A
MGRTRTSPQLLRRTNMTVVLEVMRSAGVVTVSDLIEATGLVRTTVIAVCDDLVRAGWIQEVEAVSGAHAGRPARRFRFDDRAGCVVGVDVGEAKTTAVVADLRGRVLGQVTREFADPSPAPRLTTVDDVVDQVLAHARVAPSAVLAAAVGVAAPVDRRGRVRRGRPSWEALDIGLGSRIGERHGWPVALANDANLAAMAERWCGAATGVDDLVVMLAGERIGAGVIESGRLLHGRSGGAGELGSMALVEGVGTQDGVAALCRSWAADAVRPGAPATMLRDLADPSGVVASESVFRAAAAGDDVARRILDRLADRLARITGLVGTMFDPELVVIAGAVAEPAAVLLDRIAGLLPRYTVTPPRVAVSTLGEGVVSVGAVRLALDHVERHALDLELGDTARSSRTTPSAATDQGPASPVAGDVVSRRADGADSTAWPASP